MIIERVVVFLVDFLVDGTTLTVGLFGGLYLSHGHVRWAKVSRVDERKKDHYSVFKLCFTCDDVPHRRELALPTDKATELRDWLTSHKIKIEA